MNRYDLHVARNQFDEFVKVELAPNGGWVMYQDAAARIAELEAALRVYECNGKCGHCLGAVRKKYCGRIARAVLAGGKNE